MSFTGCPACIAAAAVCLIAVGLPACSGTEPAANSTARASAPATQSARVVAATYDTGTNPFHPCFRRPKGPSAFDAIAEIRGVAQPLRLAFGSNYANSLAESKPALDAMLPFTLYVVEGTNLLVYTGANGGADLIDNYTHGGFASSQITCPEYAMAPDAFLVILNWYDNLKAADQLRLEQWGAQQEWIDVIHLNIQQIAPSALPSTTTASIRAMVDAGKMVVIAAGNGFGNAGGHIPTETVDYYSVPGILAAGANDGTGYTTFSNLDPHTVMDGCGTHSAEAQGFGSATFDGTSSASPRTTGYVLELLRQLREHFGAGAGTSGSVLVRLGPGQVPASGPLADGALTVTELHEVIRKTADPTLASSWLDGDSCIYGVPRPVDPQGNDYHRVGYGKLSEHTLGHALAVLTGDETMPERPTEDRYYLLSTTIRDARW